MICSMYFTRINTLFITQNSSDELASLTRYNVIQKVFRIGALTLISSYGHVKSPIEVDRLA